MKTLLLRPRYFLVIVVVLVAQLELEVGRRWRVVTRRDDGMETVQVAIALALGVALALLVWAAVKTSTTKYLDQVP